MTRAWLDSIVNDCEPSQEAVDRLVAGVRVWWRQGRADDLSLTRCLGLPERPAAARCALRDQWLRTAAELLRAPASEPWRRARELHDEVRRFAGRKWPCWCDLAEAPATATPLERALFRAFRAGAGDMPGTVRRLAQILAEH